MESLVLDLKILMYRNADEIKKLKKIKADSDQEMVGAMKQLKELSESRDSMQQELVALREVRDAAQEVAEVMEIPEGMRTNCSLWRENFVKYPKPLKGMSPQPPISTWVMYSGW